MSSPPSSPPRRARPSSPSASLPASAAAHLATSSTPTSLRASLATLRAHRDALSTSLHHSAPSWPSLAPSISALHDALQATQSATQLTATLASLPPSSPADHIPRLSAALRRSTQLSANLAVLTSARDFLRLAAAAASFPTSPPLPAAFLPHSLALRRARVAANAPALHAIPALDRPRAHLAARHAALLADLDAALLRAVFSPAQLPDPARDDVSVSTRTLPSASPAGSPLPSPPPRTPLHPDLVRAADALAGNGHAASVLASAAAPSLAAAIRDAVVAECPPPSRTVPSLASSSFTAGQGQGPASVHSGGSAVPARAPARVFGKDVSSASRAVCETVFERVRFRMTGVLRRLSFLANAVADEDTGIDDAMRAIWHVMERLLVLFVQALLGLPPVSAPPNAAGLVDGAMEGQQVAGLSLLPALTRKIVGGAQPRTYAWAFEQSPGYQDSFATLMNSVPALSPSIYNLETIFSPLQQFIVSSGRLLHSWQNRDTRGSLTAGAGSPSVEPEEVTLPVFLSRTVDVFVKTVRQDVKSYMGTAFGNRAGTLLQPPSTATPRGCQTANASCYVLPALPQTQILLDIIGSCLSLCVAVPTVARRLGEVINSEVIKPFSERAIYALNLAESWTDAGPLLTEIRTAAHPHDDIQNIDSNAENGKSLKNGMTGNKFHTWNTKVLRTIRKRADLTTKCLARIYDRTNHPGKQKPVRLLDDSEWNAVVRLVANAKIVIAELENCTSTEEWKPDGVASQSSAHSQESVSILRLRGALCDRGASAANQRAVIEAIGRTRSGCRMLREEVVERGITVLHTEVVLRCFSEVIRTLVYDASPVPAKKPCEGNDRVENDVSSDDAKPNGGGLSKPSSIFKASTLQLSDVERSSEDTSVAMCEYDEFGDRIMSVGDNVTDVEMEDYGFPSSLMLDPNDWKSQREGSVRSGAEDMGFAAQTQALTEVDRAVLVGGREFGRKLRLKDESIKWNLSVGEREFIFCQADSGVAAGIRVSGEMKGKGDRDVASGARVFLDAAATAGAETFGWPVVESNYSVAEGASASGGECRALLYAAGLL